jgi:hypothetical protein
MPAPLAKRAYGIAAKVTETLIESPRIRLTRSLHVAARAGVDQSVAITDMYDRLAPMV